MTQVDTTPTATMTATPATTTITTNGLDLDRCLIRSRIPESIVQFPPSIPLGRHLFERLRAHDPESLFLVHAEDPDRRCLTYGELFQHALGLSHGLVDKIGLRNGDRLAVLSPNHEHYFIADFACLFAGIAVASLNAHTTVQGTARLLMETQPHAMIVHSLLYQTARGAIDLAKLAHEPRVILLDAPTTPQLGAITKNVPHMHELMVPGQVELPSTIAQAQLDDTAYLMFTSYV
ncbi:hypothetical protein GGF32_002751 [Allomyces javanicus]|nr:hypothetical protein GGF32_002751 [Allomyces javanicus]